LTIFIIKASGGLVSAVEPVMENNKENIWVFHVTGKFLFFKELNENLVQLAIQIFPQRMTRNLKPLRNTNQNHILG